MTKIALLLTGQLRTWKMSRYLIDKIKEEYNIDIFLSINKNNNLQNEYFNNIETSNNNEINEAIKYFNPKDVFISSNYDNNYIYNKIYRSKVVYTPISLDKDNENIICKKIDKKIIFNKLYNINNSIKTEKNEDLRHYKKIFEQYFIVYKAYELLEKYIKKTSTKYDLIIRLRFDQFIWNNNDFKKYNLQSINNGKNRILFNDTNIEKCKNNDIKIKLDDGKENTVNVFGGGCYKNYAYVNDQFWCHKPDLIEKMKSFYESLPNIVNSCKKNFYPEYGCWIEDFFCKFLVENNINIEKSCLDGVFIRQNFT